MSSPGPPSRSADVDAVSPSPSDRQPTDSRPDLDPPPELAPRPGGGPSAATALPPTAGPTATALPAPAAASRAAGAPVGGASALVEHAAAAVDPDPAPAPEGPEDAADPEHADPEHADSEHPDPDGADDPDGPDASPGVDVGISTAGALRLLLTHLRPMRLPLVGGLLLMAVATVLGLGLPLAARFVLDSLAVSGPLGDAVLVLVVLVLASALLQGLGNFLLLRSAENVVQASRQRLVDRMLSLSITGMRSQAPGDLMARVTSDTALIRQIATSSLVPFVTGSITVVGAVTVMVIMDAYLFLVTVVVIAIPTVLLTLVMPRVRLAAQETQYNVGVMGSALERVLGAYTTVKAAAAEDVESARLGEKTRLARNSGVRMAGWNAVAVTTSVLAVQAAFLVVLGFGAFRVANGTLTIATLIAFLLYSMQLSQPVLQLTQAVTSFQAGRAALERIAEVDRMEREAPSGTVGDLEDATTGRPAPVAENAPGGVASLTAVKWLPAVELIDATFTYRGTDEPAVAQVSLEIPTTGVTAIVGQSGSGKSTVLKLIEGFFPLDSGTIRVAGRDLAEWNLGELRRAVALVEQETPVLAGTLRTNLTYGVGSEVDDERVLDVLEHVGLADRFGSVDHLDAEVGHRGGTLSGGERQRIAIARAMLRDPTVLLLDEATSQLDAANESIMREVVAWLGTRTAVVLVAHRLSTVVDADQIVLMESGRVRSVGTHPELVERDEMYRSMVEDQSLAAAPLG